MLHIFILVSITCSNVCCLSPEGRNSQIRTILSKIIGKSSVVNDLLQMSKPDMRTDA